MRMIRAICSMVGVVALLATAVSGCSSHVQPAAKAKLVKRAPESWFSARSFCVLPLTKPEVPRTGEMLGESIVDAWRGGLKFKDEAKVVTIVGGRYPAVDSMRIDLTDSSLIPGKKAASIGEPKPGARALAVDHFSLVAEPMVSYKAKLNMQLLANGVKFEMQKDKAGNPILMMTDAKNGTLHFDAATSDIEKVILAMSKQMSSGYAMTIRSVDLKLTNVGRDRSTPICT